MSIHLREVKSRKDMKTFIYLPEKLHANHPTWVHPIYMDERKYFNSEKNRAFTYSDAVLWLALRDGEPVGRIMGIINHRFNEQRGVKTARFGFLETVEDAEVVKTLVEAVEAWARQKGMTKIIGPYGFSDQDPEGFQIEGFEHRATIATYHNFAWMPAMVERLGYVKDIDYFVYQLAIPKEMPEIYKKLYERAQRKGQFQVVEFRSKKSIKPWIVPILSLMNECYSTSNIYGYATLDEKEMKALAKQYMPVLNPRFVKAVAKDGEIVAFIVGVPDMTEGIRRARGRLLPFGFLKILSAAKKTKQLDLLLGAIKEKYRGLGLDALMGFKMFESAWEAGLETIDTHHEMESNVRVRAEMERMGGKIYKKYRVYQKNL